MGTMYAIISEEQWDLFDLDKGPWEQLPAELLHDCTGLAAWIAQNWLGTHSARRGCADLLASRITAFCASRPDARVISEHARYGLEDAADHIFHVVETRFDCFINKES